LPKRRVPEVDEYMHAKAGLSPVIAVCSKILVLGTMPGDDLLRLQQYYAQQENQFWKILSQVYDEAIGPQYSQRLEFLHRRGLAIWDVLRSADRLGSLDSAIKNGVPNDFASLLRTYTNLKFIAFNGGMAQKLFRRHVDGPGGNIPGMPLQNA
jgi:double-stranded uracil-DNA glycosylase